VALRVTGGSVHLTITTLRTPKRTQGMSTLTATSTTTTLTTSTVCVRIYPKIKPEHVCKYNHAVFGVKESMSFFSHRAMPVAARENTAIGSWATLLEIVVIFPLFAAQF